MAKLNDLRRRLSAARRRRQLIRIATGCAGFLIAVLLLLAGMFVLDFAFLPNVIQRLALIAISIAGLVWACRRFVAPYWMVWESETAVALDIEREHHIDSDLVAALQFEQAEVARWGSWDLQAAVIDQVATRVSQHNLFETKRPERLISRVKILAALLTVCGLAIAISPQHMKVFLERLALSSARYPTRTQINEVSVNDVVLLERGAETRKPRDTKAAQGEPVHFLVHASGMFPTEGTVRFESLSQQDALILPLVRQLAGHGESPLPDGMSATYAAELPQLIEDCDYSIQIGDATTEPSRILAMKPATVKVALHVTPPDYAKQKSGTNTVSQNASVLEGSQVTLSLRSIDKPIAAASIEFTTGDGSEKQSLTRLDEQGMNWELPSSDTPLQRVTKEVRYEINVQDQDGLKPSEPLRGIVRPVADRPPSVVARIIHRVVLPSASPVVEFRVNDDYGIAKMRLMGQIEKQTDASDDQTAEPPSPVAVSTELSMESPPVGADRLPFSSRWSFDLTPYKLAPGDRLKIFIEVLDHRGDAPGVSSSSEPLILDISDEAGVLGAITEADERSETRLNDAIQKQLGVGSGK